VNPAQAILRLHDNDNVGIALQAISPGAGVLDTGHRCRSPIPEGHKVALQSIPRHQPIVKFGQPIGCAAREIAPGEHVHTHNVALLDVDQEYQFATHRTRTVRVPSGAQATFQGFVRSDGRVGTRNYLGILATVNCSAGVARFIADRATQELLPDARGVDGIVALGHGAGCCMNPEDDGFAMLQRTMAGYARHPNFYGIVLVGLGCEVNQLDCLMENTQLSTGPRLRTIDIQQAGGTPRTIAAGIEAVGEMLTDAARATREAVSARYLVVGLECGGSDAYSGISANPALGEAVDLLIRHGGTAILSETPEIYGAEHLLTRRAESTEVGESLIQRIRWWQDYTARLGAVINNNPTPGNKAGGITTILEKSLGAVAKAGSTNLKQVYRYAEPVRERGLVFMDTPGYDIVSVTGMTAGGANLICFTTGRGTPCGFKPAPTIKLASNSPMFQRMQDDMDINCGKIIDGTAGVKELGEEIFKTMLDVASGTPSCSERFGFGDVEFVPWPMGAVL